MRRREFIALFAGAGPWPFTVSAQQAAMPVIGYLSGRSPDAEVSRRTSILTVLEETGFVAGRNVVIEYRFAEGRDERLPMLASDLVRASPTLLIATDRSSALALKAATTSLNRPGGNATGVFVFTTELGPKRLGLLREVMPKPGLIAFVVNPNSSSTPLQVESLQAAARSLGQPLVVIPVSTEALIDEAFATMVQRRVAGIIYGATVFFQVFQDKLITLAAKHAIPAIYEWRELAAAGGLMSYSSNRAETDRQIGNYAGRILKGANPADLPVVQSTRFEFVFNLRTAKTLGLEVPPPC